MLRARGALGTTATSISEQLLAVPSWQSDLETLRLTPKDATRMIKQLEDFLVDQVEEMSFTRKEYEQMTGLIGSYSSLDKEMKTKILNTVISSLSRIAKLMSTSRQPPPPPSIEAIMILTLAAVSAAEKDRAVHFSSKKPTKNSSSGGNISDWNHLKIMMIESLKGICTAKALPNLYQTRTDLENLVSVIVKTAHLLVENPENCRILQLRAGCVEILATCGAALLYKNGLETIIIQDLNYLEHLAEFNADVLAKMSQQHGDPSLLNAILEHIGGMTFSTAEDSGGAKIASSFLVKLSVADPKNVLCNLSVIADFLDSELYALRMSMLEIFAVLYCHLMLKDERSEQAKTQARSLLEAIEERLRDVNSFVRCKVLQVLFELVQANVLPVLDRARLLDLVIGRVMDKSSNVRRRAIQLLGEFLRRHPFCVDGGELSLKFFEERLTDINNQLEALSPAEIKESMTNNNNNNGSMIKERVEILEDVSLGALENVETMQTLLMQKRYYSDAVKFVRQLDSVIPTMCRLLSSNTKTEVFEVMDFFVDAFIYKLHSSELGIEKMMHLIWEQDLSTEDGTKRSIKEHVLTSYRKICLEVDSRLVGKDRISMILKNLLGLVNSESTGTLASLEQIIIGFVKKGWISDNIIQGITHVLTYKHSSLMDQRSSLILFTMIGGCRPEVLTLQQVENILKIGLGPTGLSDPWIAEYTFKALRLITGATDHHPAIDRGGGSSARLTNENVIFSKLTSFIKKVMPTPRWLQVIGQAIETLYSLADQPSLIASNLIKDLSHQLTDDNEKFYPGTLIKLIYVVGHVAVCKVTHLDAIERHWKQTKAVTTSKQKSGMEGVTATEEDDIAETVRFLKENEILYGPGSLLAPFGSMIATICANDNNHYSDVHLQNVATLTLAKFMTVSSKFCDAQLALFLTILEKSPSSLIRGNLTIALGDLAQSFGSIVDSNIVYLFRRLRDPEASVKRNALMILTHLTLTGLVKLKGQVGEIARCILDKDLRVSDLARLFFHELASKDNVIYNHIPDIISSLSIGTGGGGGDDDTLLTEEEFHTVTKFIFEYIKKERQMEGLVDKLCQRFRQCSSTRQARDLACCLTFINYTSERTVRRLVESLPFYKDKLVDNTIYKYLMETLQKARKGTKAELRTTLDEFEREIILAAGGNEMASQVVVEGIDQLSLNYNPHPVKQSLVEKSKGKAGRVSRRRLVRRENLSAPLSEEDDSDDDYGQPLVKGIISDHEEEPSPPPHKAASITAESISTKPTSVRPTNTKPTSTKLTSTRPRRTINRIRDASDTDENDDIF